MTNRKVTDKFFVRNGATRLEVRQISTYEAIPQIGGSHYAEVDVTYMTENGLVLTAAIGAQQFHDASTGEIYIRE